MIVVEQGGVVTISARAWFVTDADAHEVAWAHDRIRPNHLYAWILGKYVGANEPNANGHIFDGAELATVDNSLTHAPLNLLHRPHYVLGTYAGAQLVFPTTGPSKSVAAAKGLPPETQPFVESVAAMWRYYFPDEYDMLQEAHDAGLLAQSMECLPVSVTCMNGVCGQTFPYAGRHSPTYCAHLNTPTPPRRLNKPHFSGGGLILPPARPAWRGAQITELQAAGRRGVAAAERDGTAEGLYRQVAQEFSHLGPREWEAAMGMLLALTPKPHPLSPFSRSVPDLPHAYEPTSPDQEESPCRVPGCGFGPDAPVHWGLRSASGRAARSSTSGVAALQGATGTETSAMVALYPDATVAAALALPGGEETTALHVTLVYLGSTAVDDLDRNLVEAALLVYAAGAEPFDAQVSGVGRFTPGFPAGQQAWPLYASVDSPALPEFRAKLLEVLDAAGFELEQDHGFSPHITLAYVEPPLETTAVTVLTRGVPPWPLHFDTIVLAWGSDRTIFRLGTNDADEDD